MAGGKKRIAFVFGTRPEAIKMFPAIHAMRNHGTLEPLVILSGQHRQMLDQVMDIAGLKADADLNIMRPGQSLTDVTATCLSALTPVLNAMKPDMVVVQGDTTTAFAGALATFYARVPVAHLEAGLRSGNKYSPYPEEVNRLMVSQLADIHLAPTPRARESLLREGISPEAIHVIGNTVVDALLWIKARLESDPNLRRSIEADLPQLDAAKRLILVTTHRRENFDGGITSTCEGLVDLAQRGDVEIVFPVHLNPNVQGPVNQILKDRRGVYLLKPLDYLTFVSLMTRAYLIITDSGGVQEEAPALGVPVLVTRDTTERPEGIEAGSALLVGPDRVRIVAQATRLLDDRAVYERMSYCHNPFGDGNAAERSVQIIERWFAKYRI